MDLYGAKSPSQSKCKSMDQLPRYKTQADCILAYALSQYWSSGRQWYQKPDTRFKMGNVTIGTKLPRFNPCSEIALTEMSESILATDVIKRENDRVNQILDPKYLYGTSRRQEGGWQRSRAFDGKSFIDSWTPVYRVFDEEVVMSHEGWKEMISPDLGKAFEKTTMEHFDKLLTDPAVLDKAGIVNVGTKPYSLTKSTLDYEDHVVSRLPARLL